MARPFLRHSKRSQISEGIDFLGTFFRRPGLNSQQAFFSQHLQQFRDAPVLLSFLPGGYVQQSFGPSEALLNFGKGPSSPR